MSTPTLVPVARNIWLRADRVARFREIRKEKR